MTTTHAQDLRELVDLTPHQYKVVNEAAARIEALEAQLSLAEKPVAWPASPPDQPTWTIDPDYLYKLKQSSSDEWMPDMEGIQAVLLALRDATPAASAEQAVQQVAITERDMLDMAAAAGFLPNTIHHWTLPLKRYTDAVLLYAAPSKQQSPTDAALGILKALDRDIEETGTVCVETVEAARALLRDRQS